MCVCEGREGWRRWGGGEGEEGVWGGREMRGRGGVGGWVGVWVVVVCVGRREERWVGGWWWWGEEVREGVGGGEEGGGVVVAQTVCRWKIPVDEPFLLRRRIEMVMVDLHAVGMTRHQERTREKKAESCVLLN